MPTPTGTSTMPDLQPSSLDDITLAPIVYQAPSLSDIGMKLITFEGPDLADITLDPIQFAPKTLGPAQTPVAAQSVTPSAASTPVVPIAQQIPGVQTGLKILSPKPGQRFAGSVPLEVEITGWQGIPRVNLSWWWSATVPAGQWPATPQEMTVVNHLDGKTRLVIPRSAFSKSGLWRVEASVKTGENQKVVKDVSFTLSGILKTTNQTGALKLTPKQTTPNAMPAHPAATQKVQSLPATPREKTMTPAN
jgi:hypothetical protein